MGKVIDPLTGREAVEPQPASDSAFDLDLSLDSDEDGGMSLDLDLSDDDEVEEGDDEEPRDVNARSRITRAMVDETIAERRRREKATQDRVDMGFYFSVVFPTRKERDEWLEEHGLKLRSDDYLLPGELKKALRRG